MPVVTCPKCSAGLKVPDGPAAAVRCPKCTTVFQPRPKPTADAGFEVVDDSKPAPKAAPRPASPPPPPAGPKKAFSLDEAVRSADKSPRRDTRDTRDDDDRPRGRSRRDDEDDRPRGRSRRDDDDDRRDRRRDADDDYDDDRPRKASKFGVARPGVLLLLISLGLYVGSLALHALLVLVSWMGADIPSGMNGLNGVVGLAGWVVGLVGFGLVTAGPPKSRGLAIAAGSVSLVHLVLACVVAFNERPERLGGGVAINWGALVTDLPSLDAVLTALVYSDRMNARGFGTLVLPLLAGLAELARLVLLGLLLGSLARATKEHRAEGMAKFGWIAAPSAVGVCMLVVLLATILAESTAKSVLRPEPPPPLGPGTNFQDVVRQQQEYGQRMQDRFKTLERTLRLWRNGSELLVYTLHIGTLVLPGVAAFGVWGGMGRRR
ncbi:zinc ribbon domain-containing protein [Urbifossiella limnaea]|uniref:Uncharacterized protein n=1 Tax=Urbifossiella limnaea TaxID=2528023 RepID=A0A517XLG3_9BACT|nr:hypothetical protein [Urbifossiella limnaea]QDU18306.1 hypothetical protein ETAA1_01910 [Urbifossiella limnaea]